MKKVIIAIVALVTLCGCQKEGKNFLSGTRWETTGFAAFMEPIWGYRYHVYEFTDDYVSSYWLDKNSKMISFDGDFQYRIEDPYVYVEHDTDDVRKLEVINKMTMVITTKTSIKYFLQR